MLSPFDADRQQDAVLRLDEARDQIDKKRPLTRRWVSRLRSDLEAEAVAASTRMEGVPVTVDDVRQILAGEPPKSVSPRSSDLVRGYREAMTYVLRRADDPNFEWNRELLVGIQDRVLAGSYEDGAGRLRTDQSFVVRRDGSGVVFRPPPPDEVPGRVDELCSTFTSSDWHPALGAAWVHVAFAAIHPFKDGNGRTARILSSLVMYRNGFRTPTFTSLEEWWGRHPDDYYDAFACLGEEFDPRADVTPFIKAHLGAHLSQVQALDLRERTQRGLWTMLENLLIDRGLKERAANALWDAFFGRSVTAGYYRRFTEVGAQTATADLKAATVAGLLTSIGETRARRYVAGGILYDALADELALADRPTSPEAARTQIITELSQRLIASSEGRQASLFPSS